MNRCLVVCLVSSLFFLGCEDQDDSPSNAPLNLSGLMGSPDSRADAGSESDAEHDRPREAALIAQFGHGDEQQIIPMASRSDGLSHPRDLAFDPDSPTNLWVVDRDWDGNVVLFDAGTAEQQVDRVRDMAASHFMEEVSSLAFSDRGTFATCQESRNGMDGFAFPNDFMGPALWSTDLMIHGSVNQTQVPEGLNGSHLDMLHQSPLCMGMAHQESHVFFVADGHNGHIVRYDFNDPHVPGGHDHSDGRVSRYQELTFSRVSDVPSHMKLVGNDLYYVDTGNGALKVADISTGGVGGSLIPLGEPLELFNRIIDVTQRELITGLDTPSGLAITEDHIFLSFPKTGDIVAYDRMGIEIDRLATGKPGVMGLTIGPNDRLWYVNAYEGTVNMIDATGERATPEIDLTRPNKMECMYPSWSADVGLGKVLPPLAWSMAMDGSNQLDSFSALDIFCDPEWAAVETVFFIVVPAWIPWLWEYVAYVDSLSEQIEDAGGRVVFVGAQTENGGPIGLNETQRMLADATPQRSGVRVAEADSIGSLRLIDTGLVRHLPAAFAVRRNDMRVIAAQSLRGINHLPYVEIAQDPQSDWSNPGPPTIRGTLPSNCGDGADETFEPNNFPEDAGTVGFGEVEGGVCEPRGDFYYIDVEGAWRLTLEFSHATGDLDVILFRNGEPIYGSGGEPVGASSSDDNEVLDWADPISVFIYGYEGATAPYTLKIEAR